MIFYKKYPKTLLAIIKYINMPNISFEVVIKGPVAIAGSILNLFNTRGIKVPKTVAKITTQNNAKLTVIVNAKLSEKIKLYKNIKDEQTNPFISPTLNSLNSFLEIL